MLPTFWHRLDMRLQSQMNVTLRMPASGCHRDSDETATLFMGAGRRNSRSVCCQVVCLYKMQRQ